MSLVKWPNINVLVCQKDSFFLVRTVSKEQSVLLVWKSCIKETLLRPLKLDIQSVHIQQDPSRCDWSRFSFLLLNTFLVLFSWYLFIPFIGKKKKQIKSGLQPGDSYPATISRRPWENPWRDLFQSIVFLQQVYLSDGEEAFSSRPILQTAC